MTTNNQSIVILGAGIVGVASAYYLSKSNPNLDIIVIDKLPPLSFTTSCSGENFRKYWPQPMMNEYIGHSIELMNALSIDHNDRFRMKYSGYDFVTHKQDHSIFPLESSERKSIERLEDKSKILNEKPYLDENIEAIEHVKNAGSIDVYALGSLLLKLAKNNGVKFVTDEVIGLSKTDAFSLNLKSNKNIKAKKLLLASGPFIKSHLEMLNYFLPVYNIKQRKFVFKDTEKIIPRSMPFTIYADNQFLKWTEEEIKLINDDNDYQYYLNDFPAGLHIKPEGQDQIKMGWAFNTIKEEAQWNLSENEGFSDAEFISIVLKGASRFIPALSHYADNIPTSLVHYAGYYTRTDDNLPIIGELEEGLFVAGALSGYGTMAACATGDLISQIVSENIAAIDLPQYSRYFSPLRFNNDNIMHEISKYPSGQL